MALEPKLAEILEAALQLSPEQRGALASSLIQSLDIVPPDPAAEAAWEAEILRRIQEIDEGRAELVPWSEVRRDLMSKQTSNHGD